MRNWVLILMSAAAFMVGLDVLVVTTALTTMQHELHASLGELDWILSAYTLSFAVPLMTAAALGDRFGRRLLLLAGLATFTAASAACALLPGIGGLIAARAVQGAGAAMILPHAMALLSAAYPPERRARALGLFSGFVGLAILSGPMLGGAIVQTLSWRWIFWLNVPVGLVLLPLIRLRVAESQRVAARLDYGGLVLITGGAAGLAWALVRGNAAGWGSPQVVLPAIGGAVLLAGFVAWELRATAPMLPMSLFRVRAFAAANAAGFLFYAAMYGSVFFLAQYLQVTLRDGPLATGVRMLPLTITLSLIAPTAGALADRYGNRPLILAGIGLQAAGLAWLATAARLGSGYPTMIAPMVLMGSGMSVAMPALQAAPVSAVPAAAIGKASGTFNTLRQLGATFGVAIGSAAFAAAGSYRSAAAFGRGFAAALAVCAGLAAASGVIALAVPPDARAGQRSSPQQRGRGQGTVVMMTVAEEFAVKAEPFRRELLVHCYRMLGSVHDAEDLVQDTMLRAWRSYQDYDDQRASLRTWLYRIATNACLTALEQRGRRALPADLSSPGAPDVTEQVLNGSRRTDVPWLEPFPDALADPATVAAGRAEIRLAFIAALQHLPARQRAVLLLREVLGMRAAEVAELLGTSSVAVNSALQRARAVVQEIAPETVAEPSDAAQRDAVDRYVTAFVNADVSGLAKLLAADAIMQMPPVLMWFSGRDDIAQFLSARFSSRIAPARVLVTRANGQHAIATYRQSAAGAFRPRSIAVLGFGRDGLITRIDSFLDTSLFATFGLPPVLEPSGS